MAKIIKSGLEVTTLTTTGTISGTFHGEGANVDITPDPETVLRTDTTSIIGFGFTTTSSTGSSSDKIPTQKATKQMIDGYINRKTTGFSCGGTDNVSNLNVIDKFSMASNVTAVDHGDASVPRYTLSGSSSDTQGFSSAGAQISGTTYNNVIDKFDFSSNTTGSDHGDLNTPRQASAGHSSDTQGFASGGWVSGGYTSTIEKFDFSSNTLASSHGDMILGKSNVSPSNSSTQGFLAGGYRSGTYIDISKYDFSSNITANTHGDLSRLTSDAGAGCSSTTHGFIMSYYNDPGPTTVDILEKYAFSSNIIASDHGDGTDARNESCGQSGYTNGFQSGGRRGGGHKNVIDTFQYETNVVGTDHGDLSVSRRNASGHQG